MKRRTFIAQAATAVGVAAFAASVERPSSLIDANVYLGQWPFRAFPQNLAERLAQRGVTEAWAGSADAIFHRDVTRVNADLAAECKGVLKPVGSVHPKLPDWRDDLRRCVEQHGMKVIRLHPNYHGYTLEDPAFLELLEAATSQKLLVQIVAQLEDERTQHPLVQLKPVDFSPLSAALKHFPEARVMILNANRSMSMTALAGTSVWLDIAMLESVGGVENLLKDWPLDRLVFGSYAPVFYWESAKLKLQESELTEEQLAAITHKNATVCLIS